MSSLLYHHLTNAKNNNIQKQQTNVISWKDRKLIIEILSYLNAISSLGDNATFLLQTEKNQCVAHYYLLEYKASLMFNIKFVEYQVFALFNFSFVLSQQLLNKWSKVYKQQDAFISHVLVSDRVEQAILLFFAGICHMVRS